MTDPGNKTARSSYAVDMKANSTSILRDESTLLQCVINTFNTVFLHRQQKTAANTQHTHWVTKFHYTYVSTGDNICPQYLQISSNKRQTWCKKSIISKHESQWIPPKVRFSSVMKQLFQKKTLLRCNIKTIHFHLYVIKVSCLNNSRLNLLMAIEEQTLKAEDVVYQHWIMLAMHAWTTAPTTSCMSTHTS